MAFQFAERAFIEKKEIRQDKKGKRRRKEEAEEPTHPIFVEGEGEMQRTRKINGKANNYAKMCWMLSEFIEYPHEMNKQIQVELKRCVEEWA